MGDPDPARLDPDHLGEAQGVLPSWISAAASRRPTQRISLSVKAQIGFTGPCLRCLVAVCAGRVSHAGLGWLAPHVGRRR
ncbi:MAG: hypothetical protein QOG46_1754, partial [Pseudonocardiales bacterium]|nr:hypothetical protein [Pseudonocardiales bacterium]